MGSLNYKLVLSVLMKNIYHKGAVQTRICSVNNNIKLRCFHVCSANSGIKSNLPIKWIRPEKIPCFHPSKSGDLKPLMKVDPKQLAPEFKDLEELKSADENVRKLFTLEFQKYKSTVSQLRQDYINRVKRHEFDTDSPEVRVAKMTADIRDMQRFVEIYPYDRRTTVRLKETIDKRKRLLKFLRIWDYKCFEYVLEKLELVYKPDPARDVHKRIERKRSLRMLTDEYCNNIVTEKLKDYKQELESQKESFLIEKIETLKWIMKEEEYCGVSPTVTNNDLKAVEEQLLNLRESKKKEASVVND